MGCRWILSRQSVTNSLNLNRRDFSIWNKHHFLVEKWKRFTLEWNFPILCELEIWKEWGNRQSNLEISKVDIVNVWVIQNREIKRKIISGKLSRKLLTLDSLLFDTHIIQDYWYDMGWKRVETVIKDLLKKLRQISASRDK